MTQPPPEYSPYGAPSAPTKDRTADQVISWILFVVHLAGIVFLAGLSIFSIFLTDSCGTGSGSDAAVCDTGYFGSVLIGYWIALAVIPIASLVGIIVATVRKTAAWPWSVGGIVGTGIATVLFYALVFR